MAGVIKKSFIALALTAAFALPTASLAQWEKRGVRFLSNVPLSSFEGSAVIGSAVLAYTSPSGREYAVMGAYNGKHFFEITDPTNPVPVGFISTEPAVSYWQEMALLGNYVYGVSEGDPYTGGGDSMLQIIDLSDIDSGNVTLANTWSHQFSGDGGGSFEYLRSHTIQAGKGSNSLYLNGSTSYDVRYFAILDVSDPLNPVPRDYLRESGPGIIGNFGNGFFYSHDAIITRYEDGPYAGKEVAFICSGLDGLVIADVTDKDDIQILGRSQYIDNSSGWFSYCHSGALSPDKKYFYINDELDEAWGAVDTMTIHVIDIQDLANPTKVASVDMDKNFIEHNSIVQDGRLIISAYTGGTRIYDISDGMNPVEVGFFDTFPDGDYLGFDGVWGVDGNFASGNIILSDRQYGLFVLDPTEALGFGAVPIQANASKGSLGGSFNDSRRPDGRYWSINGVPSGAEATVTLETTNLPATGEGSFSFKGRGGHNGTQLHAWAYNNNTSSWDFLVQFALKSEVSEHSVPIADVAPYVDGDNQVELKFMVKGPVAKQGGPSVWFDTLNFRIP